MIETFTEKDIKRKKRCIELVKQQFENNIFSGFFLLDENLNVIDRYGSSLKFKLSYGVYAYNKKCTNNVKEKLIKTLNETIEDLNNGIYITRWENNKISKDKISEHTIQILLIPHY